jgi:hypothetical protein
MNAILTYAAYYNVNLYSWHTCDYYSFDMNAIDCSTTGLHFENCLTTTDQDCGWACNTWAYQWQVNAYKPWYLGGSGLITGNNDFTAHVIYDRLCLLGIGS